MALPTSTVAFSLSMVFFASTDAPTDRRLRRIAGIVASPDEGVLLLVFLQDGFADARRTLDDGGGELSR
jgi:hypothetical protein